MLFSFCWTTWGGGMRAIWAASISQTPCIDALAREGMVFTNAYANSSGVLAHACLLDQRPIHTTAWRLHGTQSDSLPIRQRRN